jgi:hypothetical protein
MIKLEYVHVRILTHWLLKWGVMTILSLERKIAGILLTRQEIFCLAKEALFCLNAKNLFRGQDSRLTKFSFYGAGS